MQLINNQPVINPSPMSATTRAIIDDLTANMVADTWAKETEIIHAILNDDVMDIGQKIYSIHNALARFQSVNMGYSGRMPNGSPYPLTLPGYAPGPYVQSMSVPPVRHPPFIQLEPIGYGDEPGAEIIINGVTTRGAIHNLSVSKPVDGRYNNHTVQLYSIIDEEDVVGIAVGPLSTDLLVLDEKICEYIFDYIIKIPDLTMFQHHLTYAVRDTRLGKMLSINQAEEFEFNEDADEFWANVQRMLKPLEYSELYDW